MIKAVFLDLDDTLLWDKRSVQVAFQKTCQVAEDRVGVNPEKLEVAVREEATKLYQSYSFYSFTKKIGINPFEGLWGKFQDGKDEFVTMSEIIPQYQIDAWTKGLFALGFDDPNLGEELAEIFPNMRHSSPFLYEDSLQVLEELQKDYRLLLLTNGSPQLQNTKLTITPELVPYFEHIVISGDFGIGKPDPSIFTHALELVSLSPDEVIMVGDNLLTDILGASQAGIPSVWINREEKDVHTVTPTHEIQSLSELPELLRKING
ncbi:HAD-IA family hydrolase [Radiobacillus kanasensis]|uniref:HAD family hydrolase n=1 Tax=Radiobacillus kanasensis TaxID=2844358 RepID=UPI001E49CF72|nr:HAD-IA family hydrolase [Radiobacillus kanasensis]UFT99401.1 HAD-IA family hydrolase [Radiobacillus kanasensis]